MPYSPVLQKAHVPSQSKVSEVSSFTEVVDLGNLPIMQRAASLRREVEALWLHTIKIQHASSECFLSIFLLMRWHYQEKREKKSRQNVIFCAANKSQALVHVKKILTLHSLARS